MTIEDCRGLDKSIDDFVISLESEYRTIEALWEAYRGVMNQHPISRLLPIDVPPGIRNKIICQQMKAKAESVSRLTKTAN